MAAVIIKNMLDFRSLLYLCPAALLMAQTPPPKPAGPPPMTVTTSAEPGKAMPVVPPDRVVITVGDFKITAAQFDQLIETLPPQYQVSARGAGRDAPGPEGCNRGGGACQGAGSAQEPRRRKHVRGACGHRIGRHRFRQQWRPTRPLPSWPDGPELRGGRL